MRSVSSIAILVGLAACKGNQAPLLGAIDDQWALVSQELALRMDGRDTDGDPLTWVVSSDSLDGLPGRSRFDTDRSGATFIWTPLISDVGEHTVTVGLSDGEAVTSRSFTVSVGAGEGSTSPAFVQPLGTGGTLDLATGACLELPVVVTDPDTPGVTLGQAEPVIQGSELRQEKELEGTWSWCPTREQTNASDRYNLRLTADDFENPTVVKDYLVVLRGGDGEGCPGDFPDVGHSPRDWSWLSEVQIEAEVSDDEGLKFEPLLYYTLSDPGDEPDIAQMVQVTMELTSGSMSDGTWVATIPNPVAGGREGDSADVWYLISAADNDDVEGPCDHTTVSPEEGVHRIEVTNSGEGGGGGICEPCSADAQCGGSGDLCVNFGGGTNCFTACDDDDDCSGDTYCSFSTFTSVDGSQGRQCLPTSLSCDDDGGSTPDDCDDDAYENNDRSGNATYLPEGTYSLTSCPDDLGGSDEDWFEFDVFGDTDVSILLDGGNASDLDLQLLDTSGAVLDRGESSSSFEVVEACVPTGTYRARVYAWGTGAENDYELDIDLRPGSCPGTCDDDSYENDDGMSSATYADLYYVPWRAYDRTICSDDDDWYEVYLFDGEELHATLDFFQATADEDLDLWFVGADGTNYSDCFEFDQSGCDALNGQSGTSDERMAWTINAEDTYYVVVHGWDGSENDYDICIGLDYWECP